MPRKSHSKRSHKSSRSPPSKRPSRLQRLSRWLPSPRQAKVLGALAILVSAGIIDQKLASGKYIDMIVGKGNSAKARAWLSNHGANGWQWVKSRVPSMPFRKSATALSSKASNVVGAMSAGDVPTHVAKAPTGF